MYAGLYFGALLSLAPLILTFLAWRAHHAVTPQLAGWRTTLFRFGLFASLICAVTTVYSWLVPFPLVSDGHGGYSDNWNTAMFLTALATAFLSFLLGLFGHRSSRLLLSGAAVIQFVVAYLAVLQNGV